MHNDNVMCLLQGFLESSQGHSVLLYTNHETFGNCVLCAPQRTLAAGYS